MRHTSDWSAPDRSAAHHRPATKTIPPSRGGFRGPLPIGNSLQGANAQRLSRCTRQVLTQHIPSALAADRVNRFLRQPSAWQNPGEQPGSRLPTATKRGYEKRQVGILLIYQLCGKYRAPDICRRNLSGRGTNSAAPSSVVEGSMSCVRQSRVRAPCQGVRAVSPSTCEFRTKSGTA